MFTIKVVSGPNTELLIAAKRVRSTGDTVFYENELGTETGISPLEGCTVYVMNGDGATVAKYAFQNPSQSVAT